MAAARSPSNPDKEQLFGIAEKEMEYRTEMFSKLTKTCFSKCIEGRYKESELNMGENSCIDRCVSKYSQVVEISTACMYASVIMSMYLVYLQPFSAHMDNIKVTHLVGQLLGNNQGPM